MPMYRCAPEKLDETVDRLEENGELITQVMRHDGKMVVFTQKPVNDTGRAWIPGAKETR